MVQLRIAARRTEEQLAPVRVGAHDALRAARQSLDDAIISSACEPLEWAEGLCHAVRGLGAVFSRHWDIAEAQGGTLDQVLEARPWLLPRVRARRLAADGVQRDLAGLVNEAKAQMLRERVDVDGLRRQASQAQDAVRLHHAKMVDLVQAAMRPSDDCNTGGPGDAA